MSEGNSRSAPPVSVQTINVNVTFGAAASAIVSVGETLTSVSTKPHAGFGISMLSSASDTIVVTLFNAKAHPFHGNLRIMETLTHPRRVPRCLRYRWFVATAMAVRLL